MWKQRNLRPARTGLLLVAGAAALLAVVGPEGAEVEACSDPLSAEATAVSSLALEPTEIGAIGRFYGDRGNGCAWSAEQETALETALARAPEQGLDIGRYNLEALQRLHGAQGRRELALRDFAAT